MFRAVHKTFHNHYRRRYHGIYRHAKQLFVFDLGLLFLALALFGASLFFFFWKPGITDQIKLTLSLGDTRIKSGETVLLTAEYANHSKFKLQKAVLALRLPPGFVIDRTRTPESDLSTQSTAVIGDIDPGGSGGIGIYGTLWAEPGTEEHILALLSYTPEGKKQAEQKLGSFLVRLPESILSGTLTIASSTFPNIPLVLSYQLRNTSNRAIDNITLDKNWTATTPAAEFKNFTLGPGETKEIEGRIQTPATEGRLKVFATPQVLINNRLINQTRAEQTVAILYPKVTSAARLINPPAYGEPSQKLSVEFSWRNTSDYALQGSRLLISATPGVMDLDRTARENRLTVENGRLVVDSIARTALADGRPGSNDTFTLPMYLRPSFSLEQTENAKLQITPVMETHLPAVSAQAYNQSGEPAILPLATEVYLNASARYYTEEGDQLGRGPLPPAVGQTTKYWIMAQAQNTTNPLRDARFEAILPPGVTFTNKQSVTIGPPLAFNERTRAVTWSYGALPANSQTGLYFEVAVTPEPEQIGKILTLARNLRFFATDDVVNKPFNLTKAEITNVLPAIDRGSSAGAIVAGQ